MPLERRQQHRDHHLEPLRADPVRGLPKHDQRLEHRRPIDATGPPAPRGRRRCRAQQPDRVLAVIASDRDELVEDLALLWPTAGPISLPDRPQQLRTRRHTDTPRHTWPPNRTQRPGNTFAEATTSAGNKSAEAMRGSVFHVA